MNIFKFLKKAALGATGIIFLVGIFDVIRTSIVLIKDSTTSLPWYSSFYNPGVYYLSFILIGITLFSLFSSKEKYHNSNNEHI